MGILTDDMKRALTEQRLIFVATVCPDGTPNLSPKATTMIWDDDHILFTDLASPGTMRNLQHNPSIEINVVDQFARKGYRFKGAVAVHSGDELEATVKERMRNGASNVTGLADSVRAVVLIRIEQALPLVSPGYWGGATEADTRRNWEDYWGNINAGWHERHAEPAPSQPA
ncbi:MAG: pyridoxamine 5'-phosphate oxidase family protein [Chloroflexi bacterium]|nr:pyridoxamine 5'-phosphate oxidase family protein [Chloroflexota bacterium]